MPAPYRHIFNSQKPSRVKDIRPMPLLHCQLIGKRVWRFRTRHIQDLCGNRWRWRRKREEIVGCVGGEGIRGDCYWWRSRWRRRQVIIWRKSSTGCCGGEGGKYANRMGHRLAAAAEANNNPAVELPLAEAAEVVYKRLWFARYNFFGTIRIIEMSILINRQCLFT